MASHPQQSSLLDQPTDTTFMRTWGRFSLFWTAVVYVSIGFTLYNTAVSKPDTLRGWSGLVLIGLLAAFCGMYHAALMQRTWTWPMPTRRAVVYFPVQLGLLAALTRFNPNFGWLGWAIAGQIAGTLPIKRWPLPMLATLVLLGVPLDVYGALLRGDWLGLLLILFYLSIFIGMFVSLYIAFLHRQQLVEVVRQLKVAKQELEQQAAQAEELAALRERTRLAREMHDNLGHALVVVNVKLEAAQRLYAVDMARGNAELETTKAVVREAMAELRRSLADLRAALPHHQDLPAALQRLANEARDRSNLKVTSSTPTDVPALAPEVSEGLWRVAKEAVTNIERHAAASSAQLVLEHRDGLLVLRIADDGVGMQEHNPVRPGHYGILGMHERIEALGGTLQIVPRSNGGTLVEASVPTR